MRDDMKSVKFDRASLKTGVLLIDRQHEAYFKLVEEFLALVEGGDVDRTQLDTEVNKIVEYAVEHLDAEEHLMRSSNYPAYEVHLAKHNIFRNKLDGFTSELKTEVPMGPFLKRLSKWLVAWFTIQILVDDQQLAAFLHQSESAKQSRPSR